MTKYTPPPLKDDETRLKPYDRLSRGAKQEMDLKRRADLKKAQADADKSDIPQTMVDLFNNESARTLKDNMAKRRAAREDNLQSAKDKADYKDMPSKRLYGDDVPEKVGDKDTPLFAKGGKVTGYRGYGKAKKV